MQVKCGPDCPIIRKINICIKIKTLINAVLAVSQVCKKQTWDETTQ